MPSPLRLGEIGISEPDCYAEKRNPFAEWALLRPPRGRNSLPISRYWTQCVSSDAYDGALNFLSEHRDRRP